MWPTAISYAVSYLFIAVIWINHHYLMRLVGPPTLRLMWMNFVHLFMVSLLPFATAWIARTRLQQRSAGAESRPDRDAKRRPEAAYILTLHPREVSISLGSSYVQSESESGIARPT